MVYLQGDSWKSQPFHFTAYNMYTTHILKISITYNITTVPETLIKMFIIHCRSFMKLSDCSIIQIHQM